MKPLRKILASASAALLTLTACTNTTLIEAPEEAPAKTTTISLGINLPEAYRIGQTRAGTDVKLRYVAKLYKENAAGQTGIAENTLVATVEQLEADGRTIVFHDAEEGKKYLVTIFADYINASATKNAQGHYPDKYYDTTAKGDGINFSSQDDFFNNDARDCFALKTEIFTKGPLVYEADLTLRRVVSKVRIVAKDPNLDPLEKLKITDYSVAPTYSFDAGGATKYEQTKTFYPFFQEVSDRSQNELVYFYVFGLAPGYRDPRNGLKKLAFTLMPNPNYTFTKPNVVIETPASSTQSLVLPEPNKIYTVRGTFLTTSQAPSGDIRLNVTEDTDWTGSSETDFN